MGESLMATVTVTFTITELCLRTGVSEQAHRAMDNRHRAVVEQPGVRLRLVRFNHA
jgi:hypothetical protein